jgi:hypothetical protein
MIMNMLKNYVKYKLEFIFADYVRWNPALASILMGVSFV